MIDKVQKPSNTKVPMFWRNLQPLSSGFSQTIPMYHTVHGLTSQGRVIFLVLPVSYHTVIGSVTTLSHLMCFAMGSCALQTNVFSLRILGGDVCDFLFSFRCFTTQPWSRLTSHYETNCIYPVRNFKLNADMWDCVYLQDPEQTEAWSGTVNSQWSRCELWSLGPQVLTVHRTDSHLEQVQILQIELTPFLFSRRTAWTGIMTTYCELQYSV